MRRLIHTAVPLLLIFALAFGAGCKRRKKVRATAAEEDAGLASMVFVADPRASLQLLRGFHEVEQNAWRWTKAKFAVTVRPPKGAAQNGASLVLKFTIPDPVMERVKSMTLSANVNGASVESETYTKGGEYTFKRDVPASALNAEAVTIDFALDKYIAAGVLEDRELGVIVASVGFEAK